MKFTVIFCRLLFTSSRKSKSFLLGIVIGWIIFSFGVLQIPGWAIYAVYKQKGSTLLEKIRNAAKPLHNWGPLDAEILKKYQKELPPKEMGLSIWGKIKKNVTGRWELNE